MPRAGDRHRLEGDHGPSGTVTESDDRDPRAPPRYRAKSESVIGAVDSDSELAVLRPGPGRRPASGEAPREPGARGPTTSRPAGAPGPAAFFKFVPTLL